MNARRSSSLLALQQQLHSADDSPPVDLAQLALMFVAANRTYAIRSSLLQRVDMPDGIVDLAGVPGLPSHVVGVVAVGSEILSVVDTGLLLGHSATVRGMKARLLVLSRGAMHGFALLVERVLSRVDAAGLDPTVTLLEPASLLQTLSAVADDRR